jgi:uncharacterized repeat protein (TIGR01451 family)
VSVAADVFFGSCSYSGTWADAGYNVGSDASCFAGKPASSDINAGSTGALNLGSLAGNGGSTQTMLPGPGPLIGVIPDPATVSLGGTSVQLCPTTDQRGTSSPASTPCDAGAVQTGSAASTLTLDESTSATSYSKVGDTIPYSYLVTNTGTTVLSGVAIADSSVPGASCPAATLSPSDSETCTGSYTVAQQDLVNGSVTDDATAGATSPTGGTVTSSQSPVTVDYAPPPPVFTADQPPLSVPYGNQYSYAFAASSIPAPTYALADARAPGRRAGGGTRGAAAGLPALRV